MDADDFNASITQADDLSTVEDDTRPLEGFSKTTLNNGTLLAEDLVKRCDQLLDELEAYQRYLTQSKQGHNVEIKPFRNSIAAELKSLEKVNDYPNLSRICLLSLLHVRHAAYCAYAATCHWDSELT